MPGEYGIGVHLLQHNTPIVNGLPRNGFQILESFHGGRTVVVFHVANHHIGPPGLAPPTLVEHGEGLPYTGGGPEIDAKASASCRPLGPLSQSQQRLRVRSFVLLLLLPGSWLHRVKRRALFVVTAISLAAASILVGPAAASADSHEGCISCEPQLPGRVTALNNVILRVEWLIQEHEPEGHLLLSLEADVVRMGDILNGPPPWAMMSHSELLRRTPADGKRGGKPSEQPRSPASNSWTVPGGAAIGSGV